MTNPFKRKLHPKVKTYELPKQTVIEIQRKFPAASQIKWNNSCLSLFKEFSRRTYMPTIESLKTKRLKLKKKKLKCLTSLLQLLLLLRSDYYSNQMKTHPDVSLLTVWLAIEIKTHAKIQISQIFWNKTQCGQSCHIWTTMKIHSVISL